MDSPPAITNVTDPSFNSHRPPDRITVVNANGPAEEMTVTVVDSDRDDELFIQIFVDYAAQPLKVDANVNCFAHPTQDRSDTRTTSCSTNGLCAADDVGLHTMEVEVYDREPIAAAPWRDIEDGYFSTWTFELQCQNPL